MRLLPRSRTEAGTHLSAKYRCSQGTNEPRKRPRVRGECRPRSRIRRPLRSCPRPNRPALRQVTKWNRTSPAPINHVTLVAENNIKQRAMDLQPAPAIVNEAQLSEPIHEKTDPRARCAHHFCQRLLADLGNYRLGFAFLAKLGEQ